MKRYIRNPLIPPDSRISITRKAATSIRTNLISKINELCSRQELTSSTAYAHLYRRMFDVFGISAYRLHRAEGESILDSLERHGFFDQLYSLVCSELDYSEY